MRRVTLARANRGSALARFRDGGPCPSGRVDGQRPRPAGVSASRAALARSIADVRHASREASPDRSYRQILKSSVLIGGSSLITIAVGLLRTRPLPSFLDRPGLG